MLRKIHKRRVEFFLNVHMSEIIVILGQFEIDDVRDYMK